MNILFMPKAAAWFVQFTLDRNPLSIPDGVLFCCPTGVGYCHRDAQLTFGGLDCQVFLLKFSYTFFIQLASALPLFSFPVAILE